MWAGSLCASDFPAIQALSWVPHQRRRNVRKAVRPGTARHAVQSPRCRIKRDIGDVEVGPTPDWGARGRRRVEGDEVLDVAGGASAGSEERAEGENAMPAMKLFPVQPAPVVESIVRMLPPA